MGQWLSRARDISETDMPSLSWDNARRRHRRRRALREIQIIDSDSEDQNRENSTDQVLTFTSSGKQCSKKFCHQTISKKNLQKDALDNSNKNNKMNMSYQNNYKRNAIGGSDIDNFGQTKYPSNDNCPSSVSRLNLISPPYTKMRGCNKYDFDTFFDDSDEGIGLIEDKNLSDEDIDPSSIVTKRDDKQIQEADNSLDFANNTQTCLEDTVSPLSLPTSENNGDKATKQRSRNKQTRHHWKGQPSKRQTENANFEILMRALARKYWQPNSNYSTTHTILDADPTTCLTIPTTNGGNVTNRTDDDDTFTSVTDLSRRDNSFLHDKPPSLKIRDAVNRMQPIAEETLPQERKNINADVLDEEQGITFCNNSAFTRRISDYCSRPTSPDTRFFNEADKDKHDIAELEEDEKYVSANGDDNIDAEDLEDDLNYMSNIQVQATSDEREPQTQPSNVTHRADGRPTRATVVKLCMPIDYIRERMARQGLKVFCYRFWVDDNPHTWSAFHCQKDRRIESIGRATACHIRLNAKTRRQPSGFMKQEVVVYAPSLCALEKCCKLFDDKFPIFYASADFHKLKQSLY